MSCTKLTTNVPKPNTAIYTFDRDSAAWESTLYYAQEYFIILFESYFAMEDDKQAEALQKLKDLIATIKAIDGKIPHLEKLIKKKERDGGLISFAVGSVEQKEYYYLERVMKEVKEEASALPDMPKVLEWGPYVAGIEAIERLKEELQNGAETVFLDTVVEFLTAYAHRTV